MTLNRRLGLSVAALASLVALALGASPALAALGGDISSVDSDSVHMKAQLRGAAPTGAGYTVHAMTLQTGTVVREYASPSGTVFAVTWNGPTKPDLRQVFGTYFQQYVAAAGAVRRGPATRRHFQVHGSDLVVQSNGRMRAFHGLAYVPSLVPPNVAIGDLQ